MRAGASFGSGIAGRENDLHASATPPAGLETRRTGSPPTVYSCLDVTDADGPEATILGFGVTHSTPTRTR